MSPDVEKNGILSTVKRLFRESNALMGSAVEAQESSVETTGEDLAVVGAEAQPETGAIQLNREPSTDCSEQIYQLTIVLPPGQSPRTIKIIVT
jgi:hypothetical protein